MKKVNSFQFWKKIWYEKGISGKSDLAFLDGYEHLDILIEPRTICDEIIKQIDIQKSDTVLEVACGAGFLSQHMKNHCVYLGVDYCYPLIELNQKMHNVLAFECEANKLFFPDNSVDKIFVYGLFQYLPSLTYAQAVMQELFRVARKSVFIGDIRTCSKLKQHMTYLPEWFERYAMKITPCIYNNADKTRFNAVIKFDEENNE